ncbi:Signal transduction histidine kinase [Desulfomicrobium apsheronum]|uniref:histidine kinase n=1 Tax=Desulfomicrobium apsheronum TaxID=52560 RepID=A0A1I3TU04_9BACT|nr:ATP-binding protein [Desulfomicrobium apsheronum]SFJ74748.1 Signal transduction histidine kinase [Desulfomicrobium apsheronum]
MWNKALYMLTVMLLTLSVPCARGQSAPDILVIHSYNPGLSWTDDLHQGIVETLTSSGKPWTLSTEYLDAKRYPKEHMLQMQSELIATHVRGHAVDAVIVSDDAAFGFVLQNREELFAGVPIIFCGVNNFQPEILGGAEGITGVSEIISVRETLDAALALHPDTRNVVIIGGSLSSTDRSNRSQFLHLMPSYAGRLRFHFWQDIPTPVLLEKVATLSPKTLVFLANAIAGLDGRMLDFGPSAALIRANTQSPIYGFWDFFLGHGIVGGKLVNGAEHGRIAARMALRILDGTAPSDLPVVREVANRFFFDYRELNRFNLDEKALPEGSIVTHRPLSIFEANKRLFLIFGSIVIALLVIIISLTLVAHIRKQTLLELQSARRKADEANEAKSLFLAHMSHEIRTPLTGIMGLAELALGNPRSPSVQEYLALIRQSGQNLLHIINDILDFSKVEAGKIDLQNTPFNPGSMLESTVAFFNSGLREKGVTLSLVLTEALPETVLGDENRIRQIFFNLVGNAVKFTENGKIELRLTGVTPKESSGGMVLDFEISDTGCGIPESKLDSIFERFTQAARFPTRTYQGTGLGLAIVKQLIEAMGGSIAVQSTEGAGTTFFFSIPVEQALPEESAQDPTQNGESLVQGLTVLVAEDNPINRLFLQKSLEKLGHRVICATNGQEALDHLETATVDCVLMDIQMPVMDGSLATRHIRDRFGHNLPVIALTAHALQGDREKYLQDGFDEYLAKPISIKDLTKVIAHVCGKKSL